VEYPRSASSRGAGTGNRASANALRLAADVQDAPSGAVWAPVTKLARGTGAAVPLPTRNAAGRCPARPTAESNLTRRLRACVTLTYPPGRAGYQLKRKHGHYGKRQQQGEGAWNRERTAKD
jgi:hypothetical protein